MAGDVCSEDLLDEWSARLWRIYAHAHDVDELRGADECERLLQQFPQAPVGWIALYDQADDTEPARITSAYWYAPDMHDDVRLYLRDGYARAELTRSVGHDTVYELIADMLHDMSR